MTDLSPTRLIAGDVSSDYVFRYASGEYQQQSISPELLSWQIQRVAQDISDIEGELRKVANEKERSQREFAQKKQDLETGFAQIQEIVAKFSQSP
jgi:predicted  nucleic acid-binding Zn-ribbon protein